MSEFDSLLETLGEERHAKLVSLAERSTTGRYRVHGDAGAADCLIVPAFGFEKDAGGRIMAGPANIYLAELAISKYAGLPKILQFEVDDAYRERHPGKARRIERHREPGNYLDTREVGIQAAGIMAANGWRSAVLLGQPYHLPRADSLFRAIGVDTVVEAGIEPVWVENSEQPWTTGPEAWRPHELTALAGAAALGWLDL